MSFSGGVVNNEARVPYDNVLTNAGGGYSTQLHEFVCLESGFYQFSISNLGQPGTGGSDLFIMMMAGETPQTIAGNLNNTLTNNNSNTTIVKNTGHFSVLVE